MIYEKDLYEPVKKFFESFGYEVKAEINDCDVVAIKEEDIIIIEMKLRLNLDVILQAALRQRVANKVYIAVPQLEKGYYSKKFKNICYLLRRLEIGLVLVKFNKTSTKVRLEFEPETFDINVSKKVSKKKQRSIVREFNDRHGDNNMGGVTGVKIVTSYREKVLHVAGLLRKFGPMSAKQLRELGADDNTYGYLYNNHYEWFVRESKGIYKLTEKAEIEMEQYSDLISLLMKENK